MPRLLAVFALAAICGAVGCSPTMGTVTGKVAKADGTVVKGGTISFFDANGHSVNADIQEDGTFKAENVPLGEVKVTVDNNKYKDAGAGAPSNSAPSGQTSPNQTSMDPTEAKRRYVPISDDYSDPEKTTLNLTVKPGDQTYNPSLK
jgi:hypothetical protein